MAQRFETEGLGKVKGNAQGTDLDRAEQEAVWAKQTPNYQPQEHWTREEMLIQQLQLAKIVAVNELVSMARRIKELEQRVAEDALLIADLEDIVEQQQVNNEGASS